LLHAPVGGQLKHPARSQVKHAGVLCTPQEPAAVKANEIVEASETAQRPIEPGSLGGPTGSSTILTLLWFEADLPHLLAETAWI